MSKRDTIAALLRKANNPAASKAEAFAAMQLAVRLANKEGLSLADIEKDGDEANAYGKREFASEKDHLHPVDLLIGRNIGEFTCCKVYRTAKAGKHHIVFFGHDADVELASYLRSMFMAALENDWRAKKTQLAISGRRYDARAERQSFVRGFCDELRERLLEYAGMRKPATGTDLVVVKNALLIRRWEQYAKDNGIHLGQTGGRAYVSHSASAYADGRASGARVSINDRTMGGSVKLIGR